jgi:hypothetical protein
MRFSNTQKANELLQIELDDCKNQLRTIKERLSDTERKFIELKLSS